MVNEKREATLRSLSCFEHEHTRGDYPLVLTSCHFVEQSGSPLTLFKRRVTLVNGILRNFAAL